MAKLSSTARPAGKRNAHRNVDEQPPPSTAPVTRSTRAQSRELVEGTAPTRRLTRAADRATRSVEPESHNAAARRDDPPRRRAAVAVDVPSEFAAANPNAQMSAVGGSIRASTY